MVCNSANRWSDTRFCLLQNLKIKTIEDEENNGKKIAVPPRWIGLDRDGQQAENDHNDQNGRGHFGLLHDGCRTGLVAAV